MMKTEEKIKCVREFFKVWNLNEREPTEWERMSEWENENNMKTSNKWMLKTNDEKE